MSKDDSFRLDYAKTKGLILRKFPILRKYRDTYDCVVQDTFADYYEILGKGEWPYDCSHVAWFKTRVWYNLKDYEPFKSRKATQTWKKNVPPSFVELKERDGAGVQQSPEEDLVFEDTEKEMLADKWGIPVDTKHPVGVLLLEGHTRTQVQEILGKGGTTITHHLDKLRGKK